jgi:hypothetical protein
MGWCRERRGETPEVYCEFRGEVPGDKPDFGAMQRMLKTCVDQGSAGAFQDVGHDHSTGISASRSLAPGRLLASEYCKYRQATNDFDDRHQPIYETAYRFEMFEAEGSVQPGRPAPWVK